MKKDDDLKIYVWREWPHLCDYTHGIAMAIAKSEDNAKRQILLNVIPDYNETAIKHLLERNPDKTEEYFQNYQKEYREEVFNTNWGEVEVHELGEFALHLWGGA